MRKNKKGFTLAEIIISMTIIGIIAAITIPALLVSTNEKALEAQKKALMARVSQAMSQIEDLRVYERSEGGVDKSSAMNFVTQSLSKVYRIKKLCDTNNIFLSCDFPDEITTQNGGTFKISGNKYLTDFISLSSSEKDDFEGLDTEVAGIKTANGEAIAIYYNPRCRGTRENGYYKGNVITAMCLNMVYDLNGKENAPNEVGKDVGFLTVFFPKDPDIVAPITFAADATLTSASDYADVIAACKLQNKTLIIPTWTEGMAMSINKQLINVENDKYIVSGAGTTTGAYEVDMGSFASNSTTSWGTGYKLRCIYNK